MMNENTKEDLVTLDELQDILQIGRSTAYQLLRDGEIKAFRIGRYWKIPRLAVSEYIFRKSKLNII